MPAQLMWMFLGLGVQLTVGIKWNELVGKGRCFSRPLWRYRLFRPHISPWTGRVMAGWTRTAQLCLVLLPIYLSVVWFVGPPATIAYWAALVALYMDDYLTGDDDRWKRFKRRVKNAKRWLTARKPVEVEA